MFSSVLFLLCLALSVADDTVRYVKLGGVQVLTPLTKTDGTITAVTWKHNENIVAEWVDSTVDLGFWGVLKDRASMNKTTAVLTITDMSPDTAGRYTVEINNRLQKDGYRVSVLREVPRPEVLPQPLACSVTSESCSLACVGDTSAAEPVTFSWRVDGEGWREGGRTMQISNRENRPTSFYCRMENPVSSQDSAPYPDPFQPLPEGVSPAAVAVPVVLVVLVLAGLAGVLGFVFRKKEPVRRLVATFRRPQTQPPTTNGNGAAVHGEDQRLASEPSDNP